MPLVISSARAKVRRSVLVSNCLCMVSLCIPLTNWLHRTSSSLPSNSQLIASWRISAMKSAVDSPVCCLLRLKWNRSVMIEVLGVKWELRVSFRSGKDLEKARFGASEHTILYVFPPIQVSRTDAFFASAMPLAINRAPFFRVKS